MNRFRFVVIGIFVALCLLLGSNASAVANADFSGEEQWVARPLHFVEPAADASSGYAPEEVRAAYHLPSDGGEGTTIAIIVAYDAPTIQSDLTVFCQRYNLPQPTSENFEIHKMSAHTGTDSGWASETALDVEWARAIAPQAKILLVEAPSPKLSDMLEAIDYARNRPDVVSISMSWGDEEFSRQALFNEHLTSTYGAVFFAASGDDGAGVLWPSSSSNVVAVGGTTLNLNAEGLFVSETAWSKSGGGLSAYEAIPGYQATFGLGGFKRQVPDVAYHADPTTGYSVYNGGNWYRIGGTSAGAPQWAAIYALNQSASNTNLYQQAKSVDNATYFRDVTSGSNGAYTASAGYDLVTGLGTPLTTNFAASHATLTTNTVTLVNADQSTPLEEQNRFEVSYLQNGMQKVAYASNGSLTVMADPETNLTVNGLSTGSSTQEKWVLNADASEITGFNLTLYYYNVVAQTVNYAVEGGGSSPNPTLNYETAPLTASEQQATQFKTLSLSVNPQTVWVLKDSEISVSNLLYAGSSERWLTQQNTSRVLTAGTQSFVYRHQYALLTSGVTQTDTQWYDSGETAHVKASGVFGRTAGTGYRVTSYSLDNDVSVAVEPTLQTATIPILMNTAHQLELHSVKQYQISIDDAIAAALVSLTPPTISGDNYWYDEATLIELTIHGVSNRSEGIGQRVSAYSVNGLSTVVSSAGPVTVIDMPLFSAQTLSATIVSQYQLLTSSGSVNSVSSPPINGDAGWYDAQTTVTLTFDYLWNEKLTSRLNAVGYTIGQETPITIQSAQSGTFTVQVTLSKPETITILSVIQYPVSFQFTDQNKDAITPLKFEVETDTTVIESPRNGLWLNEGTQFQINSVIWQNVEVKPAQQLSYVANAAISEVVQCQVYDATLTVEDSFGFPVSGAEVSMTLANQTVIKAVTSNEGVVTVLRIPVGTFNAKATYLGASTTVSGDASKQPVTMMQVLLSFPTILVLLAVAFSVVAVGFITVKLLKAAGKEKSTETGVPFGH
ncbi:MAG: hypothetical protein ACBZ72_04960 [Candidatus Bathyarchaeia archaeon]